MKLLRYSCVVLAIILGFITIVASVPGPDTDPGFVMIFFNVGDEPGRCLKWDGSVVKAGTGCDSTNPKNQWEVIDADQTDIQVKAFRNMENNECLSQTTGILTYDIITAPCNWSTDSKQLWKVEHYDTIFDDPKYQSRLHNEAVNFCIYTNSTGDAYGTFLNCDLFGSAQNRQVGIYLGGDFYGSEPYEW